MDKSMSKAKKRGGKEYQPTTHVLKLIVSKIKDIVIVVKCNVTNTY